MTLFSGQEHGQENVPLTSVPPLSCFSFPVMPEILEAPDGDTTQGDERFETDCFGERGSGERELALWRFRGLPTASALSITLKIIIAYFAPSGCITTRLLLI